MEQRSKKRYLRGAISILLGMAMLVMLVPGFGIKANAKADSVARVIDVYSEQEYYCDTIQDAFDKAEYSSMIILLKDVTIPKGETVKLPSVSAIDLVLNGHTFNNEGTINGEYTPSYEKYYKAVLSGRENLELNNPLTCIYVSNSSPEYNVNARAKGYFKNSGIIKSDIYTGGDIESGLEIDMTDGEISGYVNFGGGTMKLSGGALSGGAYICNDGQEGLDVTISGNAQIKNLDFYVFNPDEELLSAKTPSVGGSDVVDGKGIPDDHICLNLEGGYYDVDPKSYATCETGKVARKKYSETEDFSKFIKINENDIESYKDCKVPSTWKADPEVYSWRIFSEGYSIADATVSAIAYQTYTGKAITPAFTVKLGTTDLKQGTDFDVAWANNIDAGTATATITGKGSFTGSKKVTFNIKKVANTLKVSEKKSKVKFANVKKTKQFVKKSIKVVNKGQGKLTYKKVKVNKKKFNKYFKVNKKTGKITIKKGLKKGTYIVTISVTAAGDKNHNKVTKKAVATIVVK
ncbi:MAG: hypothetical protein K6F55_03355 [Eubacterium sp.]|nr:hypothetical protein [Eubacterium sp.]